MIQGRGFTDADVGSAVQVCIVDQAFVRVHLQGRYPIGMRIAIRPITIVPAAPVVREIIGVVSQVKARPNESQDVPHVYVPLAQNSWLTAALVVRPVSGAAERLASEVRAAIARVDRQLPVTRIRTLDDVAWEATSRYRFRAVLVMAFAGLTLALAMVGVFGVLAYSVQQRMREFGVRVALGASATDVLRLVLTGAARITAIGATAGLIAAALISRWIMTLLFGVQPLDAMSFASALAVLAMTAAVATAVPAWRAAHVDPVEAFRNE